MKTFTLMALLTLSFSQAANAYDFTVPSNANTDESQYCLNAVTGNQTIAEIAELVGVAEENIDRKIACNGVGITDFVKQYKDQPQISHEIITQNQFSLTAANGNSSGQLCVIAASGDLDKLQRVIRSQDMNMKYFIKYNNCNNLSVIDFVKKFGSEQTAVELQNYL
ncbi:hypothetical protein [Thalassotalea atypica]|uniref:hypothetical protein n=1 Tax=Thalassotalea atypica TaxID=2054316 RepID=UPI0025747FDE|nr:hypothetical protein [Thalassotalea atypica]